MKFWESRSKDAPVALRGSGEPALLLWGMRRAFQKHARYWEQLGSRRPRVYQFTIAGRDTLEWFVRIDDRGAAAIEGRHPEPHASWESDPGAYRAITTEGAGPELLGEGRVRLAGDVNLLLELFVGIARA